MNGDDLRPLPLSMRKASLAKLLHRRPDGIFTGSFEQGEIGPDLFRKACEFGLEGLVSKRADPALPRRSLERLGQGEEPHASGDRSGDGLIRMMSESMSAQPERAAQKQTALLPPTLAAC
jgi:hypothetical protein